MSTEHKYLLDASAFANILPMISAEKVRDSTEVKLFITQLTPFEVGNAFWKLYIRGELEVDEVITLIELMQELIEYGAINIIQVNEFSKIMELVLRRKITYYDASYLYAAKKLGLTLVTDDNGLKTNAKVENIEVIDTSKLRKQHQKYFIMTSQD